MNKDLQEFVSDIETKKKQDDTKSLIKLMKETSGFKASLNGKVIGYGLYGFNMRMERWH